jgi:hypothetical protein
VDTSIERLSEMQLHHELCGIGAERETEQLVFSKDYEYVRSILFVRLVVVRPARVRCFVERRGELPKLSTKYISRDCSTKHVAPVCDR